MRKNPTLGLGALLAALATAAILAAPGGAAKPTDSIACGPTDTVLSWTSGTVSYSGFWSDGSGNQVGQFDNIAPLGNGPGSTSVGPTPGTAVSATATIIKKKGGSAKVNDPDCST